MLCPSVLVVVDHPVAVKSLSWMIFQQVLSALLHLLYLCAWVEPWVAYVPQSTGRTILSSLSCKTWYGPSSVVGGDHPSWPLEVIGNSGFFKLVHCGNFVAVISSNTYALCAGGNTALSISRMEWA